MTPASERTSFAQFAKRNALIYSGIKSKLVRLPLVASVRRYADKRGFRKLVLAATEDLSKDFEDISQTRLENHATRFFAGKFGETWRLEDLHRKAFGLRSDNRTLSVHAGSILQ